MNLPVLTRRSFVTGFSQGVQGTTGGPSATEGGSFRTPPERWDEHSSETEGSTTIRNPIIGQTNNPHLWG